MVSFNITFEYLNKPDFSAVAKEIFNILADNMTLIAPTGNSREEDYKCWYEAVSTGLQREERQIILIRDNNNIIGFFQYYINADTFMMEEIQFKFEYQGKGIFRELYGFLFSNIKTDIEYVEAYASINNSKSVGILENFGLSNIGLNKNGRSYHFKGRYEDLKKWYGIIDSENEFSGWIMNFDVNKLQWTREPADYSISADRIEIVTNPHTDLWQRTYYHFRNDNAPVLQMETDDKFFSFVVKTEFQSKHRFDQCGIVMYLDSENWLKGSIEYENDRFQHLGSVVTNNGYSDWATTEIDASIKSMWYRFSRREDDYCIECSEDGIVFKQMRVCHMWNGSGTIRFGIYACSPEDSSFKATFTHMEITECKWLAHDGQQPDLD